MHAIILLSPLQSTLVDALTKLLHGSKHPSPAAVGVVASVIAVSLNILILTQEPSLSILDLHSKTLKTLLLCNSPVLYGARTPSYSHAVFSLFSNGLQVFLSPLLYSHSSPNWNALSYFSLLPPLCHFSEIYLLLGTEKVLHEAFSDPPWPLVFVPTFCYTAIYFLILIHHRLLCIVFIYVAILPDNCDFIFGGHLCYPSCYSDFLHSRPVVELNFLALLWLDGAMSLL